MKKLSFKGAYGNRIASHFHLDHAQSSQKIEMSGDACFAVTRLKWGEDGIARTLPLAKEQALIVILQLEPLMKHKLWLGERPQTVEAWGRDTISMVDLEHIPTASMDSASDVLQFYLPRSSLVVAANQNEHYPIRDLAIRDGTFDPIISQLGRLMLPVLQNPAVADRLFLTGLMTSLYEHLRQTYNTDTSDKSARRYSIDDGLLAKVKEMIASDLTGTMSLADIASECRLPVGYLASAFLLSTGVSPHRWLMIQRVQKAKDLLFSSNLSEEDIALACGFVNRRHLDRAFATIVGVPFSVWSLTGTRQNRQKRSD